MIRLSCLRRSKARSRSRRMPNGVSTTSTGSAGAEPAHTAPERVAICGHYLVKRTLRPLARVRMRNAFVLVGGGAVAQQGQGAGVCGPSGGQHAHRGLADVLVLVGG